MTARRASRLGGEAAPEETKTKRKRVWSAGLLLLAPIVLAAACVLGDAWLKTAGGPDACPEEAVWTVASDGLTGFWAKAAKTGAVRRIGVDWPRLPAALEGLFTGLVPSPWRSAAEWPTADRWGRWLGPRFLAAGSAEGWGICVRPGLLFRGVCRFRQWRGTVRETASGAHILYAYGNVFYAWRGGALIVSRSPEYVLASLESKPSAMDLPSMPDTLFIRLARPVPMDMQVTATREFAVTGRVCIPLTFKSASLSLADVWPDAPLLAVACSSCDGLESLAAWCGDQVLGTPELSVVAEPLRFLGRQVQWDRLPADWGRDIDECALAVVDVDMTQVLPVPEVALALRQTGGLRGVHPLMGLLTDVDRWPFEWQGSPGWVAPWWGEEATLCLGQSGQDWLLTSQEPLMAALAGRLQSGEPVEAAMALRIDWRKLEACAEHLLREAAALELIPRMNAEDVEATLLPPLRPLAELGTLRLDFNADTDGWVAFNGKLAQEGRP